MKMLFDTVLLVLAANGYAEGNATKAAKSMKGSVTESVGLRSTGKSVSNLFSEKFNVMGIGLEKGQKLEKHSTPTPAFLFVHSGAVTFSILGKKEELKAGDYFAIPPIEDHEVVANEPSRLLLIK